MIKPIFEPGDFEALAEVLYKTWCENRGNKLRLWKTDRPWDSQPEVELCEHERDDFRLFTGAVENFVTAKLTSLGIDAETPEKLKFLELLQKPRHKSRREDACLYKRIAELERMIAEGPIVYANCMRTFGDSDPYVFELDSDWSTEKSSQDTHRAHLVQIESLTK